MAATTTRVEFLTALVKGLESMGKDIASRLGTDNTLIVHIRRAHEASVGMLEHAQSVPAPAPKPQPKPAPKFAGPFVVGNTNAQPVAAEQPKPQPVAKTPAKPKTDGLTHYRNVKAACKEAGLSTKGKLPELEERLAAWHKAGMPEQPKAKKPAAQPKAAKSVPTEYAQTKPVGVEDRKAALLAKLATLDVDTLEVLVGMACQ